jgi:hypothetical protein
VLHPQDEIKVINTVLGSRRSAQAPRVEWSFVLPRQKVLIIRELSRTDQDTRCKFIAHLVYPDGSKVMAAGFAVSARVALVEAIKRLD